MLLSRATLFYSGTRINIHFMSKKNVSSIIRLVLEIKEVCLVGQEINHTIFTL
jgi:hypothetical protein